ncbi:MAG: hypothetical protein ACLFQA_00275 [Bacteroidales bacterium]
MKQFKIRCSAIGQIMTEPRSKTATLSQTTITYLETWYKEQLYNRRHRIDTKEMLRGTLSEAEAIEFAAKHFGWGMVFKNEQYFEDNELTGTPDIILPDMVADIKCPWSCFTFPLFGREIDKNYWWQLQGYMALTNRSQGLLVYTLMDMPEELMDRELYYAAKRYDMIELEPEQEAEVRAELTYSNLPDSLRIKPFQIARDDAAINRIRERVALCREYLRGIEV